MANDRNVNQIELNRHEKEMRLSEWSFLLEHLKKIDVSFVYKQKKKMDGKFTQT